MGIEQLADLLVNQISSLQIDDKINAINLVRQKLTEVSPFKNEPIDYVKWVKSDQVTANTYNPNVVASPEKALLKDSILEDGFTQPIVTWRKGNEHETVDGFHRGLIGKEEKEISERLFGYLPVTMINEQRVGEGDRITSTIRHNRARGKHVVELMSQIVIDLKRRNWSDSKISKKLGMDPDEVLRLSQISGLAEMFKDREFSEAWEAC